MTWNIRKKGNILIHIISTTDFVKMCFKTPEINKELAKFKLALLYLLGQRILFILKKFLLNKIYNIIFNKSQFNLLKYQLKMNIKCLKDLPRIFFSRCHRGHLDRCPHGSGGKATQTTTACLDYCIPRLLHAYTTACLDYCMPRLLHAQTTACLDHCMP